MDIEKKKISKFIELVFGNSVHVFDISKLAFSTRTAPWLVDTLVGDVKRKFVFRMDAEISETEVKVMQAVRACSDLPVPEVYGWDVHTQFFDTPCFIYDYVDGDSLIKPLLANESWAISC